jgi:hypothetical protein
MTKTSMRRIALLAFAAVLPGTLLAQTAALPWQEYSKLIETRQAVAAYGPDLLGDEVNLANGALSFSAVDIAIPGNSGLDVSLRRNYAVSAAVRVKVVVAPFMPPKPFCLRLAGRPC